MYNKKIKIFHIIPTLDFGGAERLLVDLAKTIDQENFIVKIICLKRGGELACELPSGIEIIILNQKSGLDFGLFVRLLKILKFEQPDIVHTHLFGADIYGVLTARLAKVKNIISTEHNINYFEGSGKRLLKKLVYKLADMIIAVSGAVKDYLIKEGSDDSKILVIYNGTDTEKFFPSQKVIDKKEIVIGSVGRLDEQKNYPVLIEALNKIKDKNFNCLIAGDGPQKAMLIELTQRLGLAGKVKFAGWVNNMPQFLQSIDVFVLPSAWEGFGITVIEAGATGVPVIAARVDGIKEIINDGVDGVLFNPQDSTDLAKKIIALLDNQEQTRTMAKNLTVKVNEQFSLSSMAKHYEDVYKTLFKK